ncbi:MAG: hypothetical protein AAF938_13950 [Myxococcota bacterium]
MSAALSEALVAAVAADVSQRMAESAAYAQLAVGAFVEEQPDAARFLSAKLRHLGDAAIEALFHAEVLAECLRRARQTRLPALGFADLDANAETPLTTLRKRAEPLADYLDANVDHADARDAIALVAVSLL